jgi:integrase
MMPSRKTAIPLVVDVADTEIVASLRKQRGRAGNWNVRFKMNGDKHEISTGTNVLVEAKRIARQIIRGERPAAASPAAAVEGMTVEEFERIQREHHQRNGRQEAGDRSLSEFLGIWQSFLRVCPVVKVQEVTEHMALKYMRALVGMSKTQNRSCEEKSPERLSVETIRKHIRTLSAAWNRIRVGHRAKMGGLRESQLVHANPWEGIQNNLPQSQVDDDDPVQFELVTNDLGRFLDHFKERPVGELFIITSLWSWGRITEMTLMEWSWIQGDYIVIPKAVSKNGRGKVTRLPPLVRQRLEAIRVPGNPYVFAGWADDVKSASSLPTRVQAFAPNRMVGQMEKLIADIADEIGRPEISHHALRRTAMELGEEAELRQAETTSAEKLQTTVGNKRRNYTKRLGKKAFTFADGLYRNLTTALHDFPALAIRLGCEPLAALAEREAEALMDRLTPIQRQRLARRLLEGNSAGEGQGVG